MWCRLRVALSPSLGADGPTSGTQGGFCCLNSSQQSWSLGHYSSTLASYYMCLILHGSRCRRHPRGQHPCSSHQHTAGSPSPGGACLRACWRPAEASGGPLCRPIPGVLQGGKTFTIQVGQRQEIISVDGLRADTGYNPVSPAKAISQGCPSKKPATPPVHPAPF
jgi:hypothetical protein